MKAKLIKIWEKFKALLKQGLTPKQLALSLVVAGLVAVFPIFGITTIALTTIALPFKLNLPIMIAFSYLISPIQILLFIPFINIGASVFGTEHTLLTFEAIKASYETGFWQTARDLSFELICGAVGWALTAIPVGIVLYFILKAILTHFDSSKNQPIKN
tara:strand:- start:5897 stop:6373 length:477 start_codon:yes stop_codon:yes gene_type:complete